MFNLSDYEPVEVRLEKFIKDHPDFRISTELEVVEASRYIVKAISLRLAKIASRGQRGTLRKQLALAASIKLLHWRIARHLQLAEHLQMRVMLLKESVLAAKK